MLDTLDLTLSLDRDTYVHEPPIAEALRLCH